MSNVDRIANIIIREFDTFRDHFKPHNFESFVLPSSNFTKAVGPTPTPEDIAVLNTKQHLLAKEPFVAYVKVLETKKLKSDDTIQESKEAIYLFNRYGTAGIEPITDNARFIPLKTYLGPVASADIGLIEDKLSPSEKPVPWYFEIEVLEKDIFVFDPSTWDARENRFSFENETDFIESLRKFKETATTRDIPRIEAWRLSSTKFGLRDRPVLDSKQDRISRLPLNSRIILTGFPGTGKTTTMIRRLGFKTDPEHTREYHDNAIDLGNWVVYTPNDTLRSYVMEAMAREGLAAPSWKVKIWDDDRKNIARDELLFIGPDGDFSFIEKPLLKKLTNKKSVEYFELFKRYLLEKEGDDARLARSLRKIPAHYRSFRSEVVEDENSDFFRDDTKDDIEQGHISPGEVDILILSALSHANAYLKANSYLFATSTGNVILENIKGLYKRLVAVDEASDFSVIQLACLYHLADPRLRSFLLVGDLMQRVTHQGIDAWEECDFLASDFQIEEFSVDYRLTPKLATIAAKLAGRTNLAPNLQDTSPNALRYAASDSSDLSNWFEERILEIWKSCGKRLPAIAVFVPSESDIDRTQSILQPKLERYGFEVEICKHGKTSGEESRIRIFSVQFIKGLEFDGVFFIDVDRIRDLELIDKYLYVGLTRSRAFLAVTYSDTFPHELSTVEELFVDGDWKTVIPADTALVST